MKHIKAKLIQAGDDGLFDNLFDTGDEPPKDPRYDVEKKLGSGGSMMDTRPLVRKNVGIDRLWYFRKKGAFYIKVDGDERAAKKTGLRFQKTLRSSRNLPSSMPELRDKDLYVGYDGGFIHLQPLKVRAATAAQGRKHDNPYIGKIFGKIVIWFNIPQQGTSKDRHYLWTGSGLKPEEKVKRPKEFESEKDAIREIKTVVVPHIRQYKTAVGPHIRGY